MANLFAIIGVTVVVLVLIVAVLLWLIYMYNPVLVNGLVNARYPLDIKSDNLSSTLNEFTVSFWYYVEGWNYKYNEQKTLLNWDNGKLKVTFDTKKNNMAVSMKDLNGESHVCKVVDLKLQKWNFVSITLWNRSLDIMLDDEYSHSCAQDNTPSYVNSDSLNLFGNDGFNGNLSNLYFYNYARTHSDSLSLYYKGPDYKNWLYALSAKLQGSVKISMDVNVDVNFSGDVSVDE